MPRRKTGAGHQRLDEWELHRRELYRLFIAEKRSVKDLSKYMKEQHGFDKTPKDYEYRFSKWRFRRNLGASEVKSIQDQWLRRDQAGKRSEVVVSGIRWPISMIRGRLSRHKVLESPEEQHGFPPLSGFVARVQTPSPLMSKLPEWPKELPWLQFNQRFRQALAPFTTQTVSRPSPQGALFIEMARRFTGQLTTSETVGVESLHHPRKMRALLELIAPQVHEGDHETTAEILHTGSPESLIVELVRLIIYLTTNNMIDQLKTITGCEINFENPENELDFLRHLGILTKAKINELARSAYPTNQAFLERLLSRAVLDDKSCDVLGWLVPGHFNVNHLVRIPWLSKDKFKPQKPGYSHITNGTLLQASSLAGNINAVRLLLDLRANQNDQRCSTCPSPLECAALSTDHARAMEITEQILSTWNTSTTPSWRNKALEMAIWPAIASANTRLITRLLSELKPPENTVICHEHLIHAVRHGDCDTIRYLVNYGPLGGNDSIIFPKGILISAIPILRRLQSDSALSLLDKLDYLLELNADPAVLGCNDVCDRHFILERAMRLKLDLTNRGRDGPRLEEKFVLNVMALFRKHGCPPEMVKSTSGYRDMPSALQIAISRGFSRVTNYMLDWGADINYYNNAFEWTEHSLENCGVYVTPIKGRSPLLTALQYKRTDIAKVLLRRNPKLKLHGTEHKLAARIDDTELVSMILQTGAEKVDHCMWRESLEEAIMRRSPRTIKWLLLIRDGATINSIIILEAALVTGDYDTAYQIAAVCNYSSRSLYHAVRQSFPSKDCLRLIERILETRRAAPNDDFEVLAVAYAAAQRNTYLMGVLMETLGQGPWTIRDWRDGLIQNLDIAWLCVGSHILDIVFQITGDTTPIKMLLDLHVSAIGMELCFEPDWSLELWRQLITAGADPTKGMALFDAILSEELALVKVLCEAGALVDAMKVFKDRSRTAVQLAVEHGKPDMVEVLLRYTADVNYPAGLRKGASCLQLAVGNGHIGIAWLLLHKGAKVNAKRSLLHGRTAIEMAAESGRLDMLKLLLLQEEHLFRTPAERYQFIRAAKLAENEGYGSIITMLRHHISWDSNDQRLFDEIHGFRFRLSPLDEMTQRALDCERSNPYFLDSIHNFLEEAEFEDIYDMEEIEQWVEEIFREESNGSVTASVYYSSEGDDQMFFEACLDTAQHREATSEKTEPYDEYRIEVNPQSHGDQLREIMAAYGGIRDASLDLTNPTHLLSDVAQEQPRRQWCSSRINPENRNEGTQVHIPEAMCHQNMIPAWLDMQENDTDNMMQDLGADLVMQDTTWELLADRPVAQNVGREFDVAVGDVLDEALPINDMFFDFLGTNPLEAIGEANSSQEFEWGFWCEEQCGI
ncbi:hypothetical protein N8I77_005285 [Diaporthe amygdali]|uniref:Clr5 domain-containing protein n=1 Tax=Phomopsis amygdali TaxID=1214568 RepID=A0AAD9SFF2_PHOAM|nr:hypothetical protein N8I77_005285 [Diaporthe amygdali]